MFKVRMILRYVISAMNERHFRSWEPMGELWVLWDRNKRKAWSVCEKLAVVDRIKKGETRTKMGQQLSVSESTLRGWLKDETKLRDFVDTVDEKEGLQRKRARKADFDTLDTLTFNWYVQEQSKGTPIQGFVIQEKANFFARQLNPETEFDASRGWLYRFQQRHGIGQTKACGEVKSADMAAAEACASDKVC